MEPHQSVKHASSAGWILQDGRVAARKKCSMISGVDHHCPTKSHRVIATGAS